ncbi:hypothetical protein L596_017859 [Steinernema carpocapsae]|uniref:Prolylcarboxypeptidase n=1 Tax=Steinernema carpocapsae TaxID=34508 RepID=A0A4U5N2W8_STECR|nr:hypothetical protein L596_017859 [Steinernema carpocapsae]
MSAAWVFLILALAPCVFGEHDRLQDVPGNWKEEFFVHMPLDHFNFADTRTFNMRYFLDLDYYEAGKPIFFYCGNEGFIEFYMKATSQILEWAKEFNAAVVYAEHRFYGETMPFGNESYTSAENLGYMTSSQALADYAKFIGYLKQSRIPKAQDSTVVVFGGSYGGMLAAWFRAKYPNIVDVAVASSAPVKLFVPSGEPYTQSFEILTRTLVNGGCNKEALYKSWGAMTNLSKTESGRSKLNAIFHLAEKSQIKAPHDVYNLFAYIQSAFVDLTMVDYPYENDIFNPLPAWPVKEACKFFKEEKKSNEDYAKAMFEMLDLIRNYDGKMKEFCVDSTVCEDDRDKFGEMKGWNWQSCTEFVLSGCSRGLPYDIFENSCPFTLKSNIENCLQLFKSIGYTAEMMRPASEITQYGENFTTASRIIFTYGDFDLTMAGAWSTTSKVERDIVNLIVKEGAHMYVLAGSHDNDTEFVKETRNEVKKYMNLWINNEDKDKTKNAVIKCLSLWVVLAFIVARFM